MYMYGPFLILFKTETVKHFIVRNEVLDCMACFWTSYKLYFCRHKRCFCEVRICLIKKVLSVALFVNILRVIDTVIRIKSGLNSTILCPHSSVACCLVQLLYVRVDILVGKKPSLSVP